MALQKYKELEKWDEKLHVIAREDSLFKLATIQHKQNIIAFIRLQNWFQTIKQKCISICVEDNVIKDIPQSMSDDMRTIVRDISKYLKSLFLILQDCHNYLLYVQDWLLRIDKAVNLKNYNLIDQDISSNALTKQVVSQSEAQPYILWWIFYGPYLQEKFNIDFSSELFVAYNMKYKFKDPLIKTFYLQHDDLPQVSLESALSWIPFLSSLYHAEDCDYVVGLQPHEYSKFLRFAKLLYPKILKLQQVFQIQDETEKARLLSQLIATEKTIADLANEIKYQEWLIDLKRKRKKADPQPTNASSGSLATLNCYAGGGPQERVDTKSGPQKYHSMLYQRNPKPTNTANYNVINSKVVGGNQPEETPPPPPPPPAPPVPDLPPPPAPPPAAGENAEIPPQGPPEAAVIPQRESKQPAETSMEIDKPQEPPAQQVAKTPMVKPNEPESKEQKPVEKPIEKGKLMIMPQLKTLPTVPDESVEKILSQLVEPVERVPDAAVEEVLSIVTSQASSGPPSRVNSIRLRGGQANKESFIMSPSETESLYNYKNKEADAKNEYVLNYLKNLKQYKSGIKQHKPTAKYTKPLPTKSFPIVSYSQEDYLKRALEINPQTVVEIVEDFSNANLHLEQNLQISGALPSDSFSESLEDELLEIQNIDPFERIVGSVKELQHILKSQIEILRHISREEERENFKKRARDVFETRNRDIDDNHLFFNFYDTLEEYIEKYSIGHNMNFGVVLDKVYSDLSMVFNPETIIEEMPSLGLDLLSPSTDLEEILNVIYKDTTDIDLYYKIVDTLFSAMMDDIHRVMQPFQPMQEISHADINTYEQELQHILSKQIRGYLRQIHETSLQYNNRVLSLIDEYEEYLKFASSEQFKELLGVLGDLYERLELIDIRNIHPDTVDFSDTNKKLKHLLKSLENKNDFLILYNIASISRDTILKILEECFSMLIKAKCKSINYINVEHQVALLYERMETLFEDASLTLGDEENVNITYPPLDSLNAFNEDLASIISSSNDTLSQIEGSFIDDLAVGGSDINVATLLNPYINLTIPDEDIKLKKRPGDITVARLEVIYNFQNDIRDVALRSYKHSISKGLEYSDDVLMSILSSKNDGFEWNNTSSDTYSSIQNVRKQIQDLNEYIGYEPENIDIIETYIEQYENILSTMKFTSPLTRHTHKILKNIQHRCFDTINRVKTNITKSMILDKDFNLDLQIIPKIQTNDSKMMMQTKEAPQKKQPEQESLEQSLFAFIKTNFQLPPIRYAFDEWYKDVQHYTEEDLSNIETSISQIISSLSIQLNEFITTLHINKQILDATKTKAITFKPHNNEQENVVSFVHPEFANELFPTIGKQSDDTLWKDSNGKDSVHLKAYPQASAIMNIISSLSEDFLYRLTQSFQHNPLNVMNHMRLVYIYYGHMLKIIDMFSISFLKTPIYSLSNISRLLDHVYDTTKVLCIKMLLSTFLYVDLNGGNFYTSKIIRHPTFSNISSAPFQQDNKVFSASIPPNIAISRELEVMKRTLKECLLEYIEDPTFIREFRIVCNIDINPKLFQKHNDAEKAQYLLNIQDRWFSRWRATIVDDTWDLCQLVENIIRSRNIEFSSLNFELLREWIKEDYSLLYDNNEANRIKMQIYNTENSSLRGLLESLFRQGSLLDKGKVDALWGVDKSVFQTNVWRYKNIEHGQKVHLSKIIQFFLQPAIPQFQTTPQWIEVIKRLSKCSSLLYNGFSFRDVNVFKITLKSMCKDIVQQYNLNSVLSSWGYNGLSFNRPPSFGGRGISVYDIENISIDDLFTFMSRAFPNIIVEELLEALKRQMDTYGIISVNPTVLNHIQNIIFNNISNFKPQQSSYRDFRQDTTHLFSLLYYFYYTHCYADSLYPDKLILQNLLMEWSLYEVILNQGVCWGLTSILTEEFILHKDDEGVLNNVTEWISNIMTANENYKILRRLDVSNLSLAREAYRRDNEIKALYFPLIEQSDVQTQPQFSPRLVESYKLLRTISHHVGTMLVYVYQRYDLSLRRECLDVGFVLRVLDACISCITFSQILHDRVRDYGRNIENPKNNTLANIDLVNSSYNLFVYLHRIASELNAMLEDSNLYNLEALNTIEVDIAYIKDEVSKIKGVSLNNVSKSMQALTNRVAFYRRLMESIRETFGIIENVSDIFTDLESEYPLGTHKWSDECIRQISYVLQDMEKRIDIFRRMYWLYREDEKGTLEKRLKHHTDIVANLEKLVIEYSTKLRTYVDDIEADTILTKYQQDIERILSETQNFDCKSEYIKKWYEFMSVPISENAQNEYHIVINSLLCNVSLIR